MLIRPCPPGLSPFICIRPGNPARLWRKLGATASRPISSSVTLISGYPLSRPSARNVGQSSFIRRNCINSQGRLYSQPAVAEDPHDPLTNVNSENRLPTNLEKLTVKELKDLLASRSLKTSGVKSELIERLQAAAEGDTEPQVEQSDAGLATIPDALETFSPWSKMTVKDLKTRLSELGLSTTGLKSELIERLHSASVEEIQATPTDEAHTEHLIEEPSIQHLRDVDPTSPLEPIVIPEKVTTTESAEPIDSSMIPSIPQPQTPPKPTLSAQIPLDPSMPSETVIQPDSSAVQATAGISTLVNPLPDVESSSTAESESEAALVDEKSSTHESNEMHDPSIIASSPQSPTMSTEEVGPADSSPEPLSSQTPQIQASTMERTQSTIAMHPSTTAGSQSFPALSHLEALESVEEDLSRSQVTLELTQERVEGFWKNVTNDTILAHATGFPRSPMLRSRTPRVEDMRLERTMSLAKLYFSRAFQWGVSNGPQSTGGLRFIDFARQQEAELFQCYLDKISSRSNMESQATEDDFAIAWREAVKEYGKGAGEPFVTQPKVAVFLKKNSQTQFEVPPRPNNLESTTPTSQEDFSDQTLRPPTPPKDKPKLPSDPSPRLNNSRPTAQPFQQDLSKDTPRAAAPPLKHQPKIRSEPSRMTTKPRLASSNVQVTSVAQASQTSSAGGGQPQERTKPDAVPVPRSADGHHILTMAKHSQSVTLSISPEQKRAFLLLPDSGHTVGPFATDGDPYCQIYNSMWTRLGLMDHIISIEKAASIDDNAYTVTFKNFDGAAAFVNRVDQHWLHDALTGQIYATWDVEESEESRRLSAVVNIPRATLQVWRREALKAGIPQAAQGYPLVEWPKAMWSVLRRMGLTVGSEGDCTRYRMIWERKHRGVLDVHFREERGLQQFLNKKQDHYLTNPSKDRFFARRLTRSGYSGDLRWIADNRLRPESMVEPTEENPVPATKNLSNVELNLLLARG